MSLIGEIPLNYQKRWILHIDADAFFATIEQSLNPQLKGVPVIIGGPTRTTGVVATASYEAKIMGVKSAMPMYQAMMICPNAVIVRPRMEIYKKYSQKMYEIFTSHTAYVEMTSIDEAYLDITDIVETYGETPTNIAKLILTDVYEQLKISISCGCASNKLIAKVASGMNKPHKLTFVAQGFEQDFMSKLLVSTIPGVGPKMSKILYRNGIKTNQDVVNTGLEKIIKIIGKQSASLWKSANGLNNAPVKHSKCKQKSISKEQTFYEQYDQKYYQNIIKELLNNVIERLNNQHSKAKTATLKIHYKTKHVYNFNTKHTYNINLGTLSSSYSVILKSINNLFLKNYDKHQIIRLIGVGVTNVKKHYNMDIFENCYKNENLTKCMYDMQKKYGGNVIHFG